MLQINGRSTVNTVVKDPACSKWLRDALTSALACDPADVMHDAAIIMRLMIRYTPVLPGLQPSKRWPGTAPTCTPEPGP